MIASRSRREILLGIPALLLAACNAVRHPRAATTRPAVSSTTPASKPATTASPTGGPARFVRRGPADARAVAFTFHGSGDVGLLDALLAVAADAHAPLTIFAVGQWLDTNPSVARRILDDAHELANHTYTHPALGQVSGDRVRSEITQCRDALSRHAGAPGLWFRPSGIEVPGLPILAAAGVAGYATVVGYDVDPRDYQDPGASAVRARTASGLHPGAIVSLHTGHRGTVDAMAGMLADAVVAGLKPVTVSTLLRP